MLSNCGHDENGRYSGGRAGDQTGTEWQLMNWYQYSGGWQYMIRHPNPEVGKLIAELAKEAANNNHIGYDQNERGTFWQNLKASGYRPKNITVNCETDCSAGCAALAKAAGYLLGIDALKNISADCYTGNIRQALAVAGFTVYSDSKYLTSEKYLREGDFLLKEFNHITTCVWGGGGEDDDDIVFTYRVRVGGRWLPEVTNLNDYAGFKGKPITDIAIKVNKGSVWYQAHNHKGGWLGKITGYNINDSKNGYAGNGNNLDAIKVYYTTPSGVMLSQATYRVSPLNGNYYDWQTDTDTNKGKDGYAGAIGKIIDRFQIYATAVR